MDRRALHAALVEARIPGGYYRIEGVHEPAPTPPDFLFVRRGGSGGSERSHVAVADWARYNL